MERKKDSVELLGEEEILLSNKGKELMAWIKNILNFENFDCNQASHKPQEGIHF
jgi:hypothetical protein